MRGGGEGRGARGRHGLVALLVAVVVVAAGIGVTGYVWLAHVPFDATRLTGTIRCEVASVPDDAACAPEGWLGMGGEVCAGGRTCVTPGVVYCATFASGARFGRVCAQGSDSPTFFCSMSRARCERMTSACSSRCEAIRQ